MPDFAFHHGAVSVPNVEEAVAWYRDMLGFEVEVRFWIEAAKAKVAMMRKGPLRFEIFEVEGAKPLPEERRTPPSDLTIHGNKHVAFRVADLDLFLDEMNGKKADIAFIVREEFGNACFLRDCAGNLIEFVEDID